MNPGRIQTKVEPIPSNPGGKGHEESALTISPASLVSLVSICWSLHAQQPTGSITGIVRDATGAVIPGAAVLLTHQATGVALQQTTSEAGMYTFGSLLPGTYQIKVEASGFKTASAGSSGRSWACHGRRPAAWRSDP